MSLSNAHVKANVNKGEKGDSILQQAPYDGGENPEDKLEELYDSVPIKMISSSNCPVAGAVKKCLNSISKLLGRETRFKIKKK